MQIPACYQMLGVCFLKNNIKVKNIKLPAVRVVGTEAFFNCTALRHAALPRVYVIKKGAFGNCSNLREILLPKTVRELGKGVFDGCMEKSAYHSPCRCGMGCAGRHSPCLRQITKRGGLWIHKTKKLYLHGYSKQTL